MTEEHSNEYLAPHSIQRAMRDMVKQIQVLHDADNGVVENTVDDNGTTKRPLSTRFSALDELLGGLVPGELIIVSGGQAGVTSDFLYAIASSISIDSETPIALCTPEISVEHCQFMLFSSMGQINKKRILTGEFSKMDWPRLTSAMNRLYKTELYIYADDTSRLSDLACLLHELKKYSGLSAVFVDSIAALKSDDIHCDKEEDQVDSTIQSLQSLATELDVPIIVSMDSTDTIGSNRYGKPLLQDLNLKEESLKLADRIAFLHDDEIDNEDSAEERMVDVVLAQNAFGATGAASLRYIEKWGMFASDS